MAGQPAGFQKEEEEVREKKVKYDKKNQTEERGRRKNQVFDTENV